MKFRVSSFRFRCLALLTVAALASLLASRAQGAEQRRGRSIEFSEPRIAEVITNLNQLATKNDGLKQLEEDLYRPLETVAPKNSLDGFFDPPQQRHRPVSAIQSRRGKGTPQRQKKGALLDAT